MKKLLVAATALAAFLPIAAFAGSVGPVGGTPGSMRTIGPAVGGLHEFTTGVRQSDTSVAVGTTDTAIPEGNQSISCKGSVNKCIIVAEITAQVSSAAGDIVSVCPRVDGIAIDGGCRNVGSIQPFFLYTTMAAVAKTPGTSHTVGFTVRKSTAGTLFWFSARYTSLYK